MNGKIFRAALPVWAENESKTKNVTCVFGAEFSRSDCAVLKLTACNFYRVTLNGKFIGYGPARAPRGFYRVDEYRLGDLRERNTLTIEVAGYNCNSFYGLNEQPFLQAELMCGDRVVATGTADGFTCAVSLRRIRKCPRYSYQRPFTECYDYTLSEGLKSARAVVVSGGKLLPRGVSYPRYGFKDGKLAERGVALCDSSLPVYQNRCLFQDSIGLYPLCELEVNPNEFLSKTVYSRDDSRRDSCGKYAVYDLGTVKSGFIGFDVSVSTPCEVYAIFDETDGNPDCGEPMNISYSRNDSLNFIYCKFGAGEHKFLSFEPYSFRYVKIIVSGGAAEIKRAYVTEYENPDTSKFRFECSDGKLEKVAEAARNTFAQNAVDIPTDCPGRERAGWLCDAYFISLAEKLFTGNNAVERNFLENYALEPRYKTLPDKMIGMCWPADFEDGNYIPNWAMLYVLELNDYYRRTGDADLVQKSKSAVYGLIDYFRAYLNPEGLLENLDGWIFIEWSGAGAADFVSGVSFPSNMLYARMLDCAASLYGDKSLSNSADGVRSAVRKYSYNGEFFEDNAARQNGELRLLGHISETCQYYAFFTDTATPETHPELWEKLVKKFGPSRDENKTFPHICKSVPFIGNYLRLISLLRHGFAAQVLDECKAFFYPMAERTGTLWEHGDLQASLNHGFAAFAANLIVMSLTGIVGVSEADKSVTVARTIPACAFSLCLPLGSGVLTAKSDGKNIDYIPPKGYELKIVDR